MSTPISGQGPAVAHRSRQVRMVLAIAVAAAAAIAITLALVVAISGGSDTVANSSAGPQDRDASTACGVHYWGSTLVQGPPCRNRGSSR
jgi:hypothetical protein